MKKFEEFFVLEKLFTSSLKFSDDTLQKHIEKVFAKYKLKGEDVTELEKICNDLFQAGIDFEATPGFPERAATKGVKTVVINDVREMKNFQQFLESVHFSPENLKKMFYARLDFLEAELQKEISNFAIKLDMKQNDIAEFTDIIEDIYDLGIRYYDKHPNKNHKK
jgi:hypothetical protein